MPEKKTLDRARRAKRQGKPATTQAGAFVREEIHHVREGKHGVRSKKQAVAIGLAKARRAGVDLRAPAPGETRRKTRLSAKAAHRKGQASGPLSGRRRTTSRPSAKRSASSRKALQRERKSI